MPRKPQTPKKLGPAGQRLWRWALERFEFENCEPVLEQLCEIYDRLEGVRTESRKQEKTDSKLVNAECKLLSQYNQLWKTLGLNLEEEQPKNRVGRPAGVPARKDYY